MAHIGFMLAVLLTSLPAAAPARQVTPLFKAAASGDVDMLKVLLAADAGEINTQDEKGWTPLIHAIASKHPEAALWLIARGADVNLASNAGSSPVAFAVGSLKDTAVLRALLDKGADVHRRSKQGVAPLFFALRDGSVESVKLLLERGAELRDSASLHGVLPTFAAAEGGQSDVLTFLESQGFSLTERSTGGKTLLMAAAGGPSAELVEALIARGLDVNATDKRGVTPLMEAAAFAREDNAKVLLAHGADVMARARGERGEMNADASNMVGERNDGRNTGPVRDIIDEARRRWLLATTKETVNTLRDSSGNSPLHWAAMLGYRDIAASLLDMGAAVDATNGLRGNYDDTMYRSSIRLYEATPLLMASRYSQEDVLELLLERGAKATATDDRGNSPLYYAWGRKQVAPSIPEYRQNEERVTRVVNLLLAHGADPGIRNAEGQTAVERGVELGYQDLARRLFKDSAQAPAALTPNEELQSAISACGTPPKDFACPVAHAIVASHPELVNARDKKGRPTLFSAVVADLDALVDTLIAAGADVDARDDGGVPVLLAAWDPTMAAKLINAGANVKATSPGGTTVLHQLMSTGTPEIVELAISRGADVNARDEAGRTPLALVEGRPGTESLVKLLLEKGAVR